MCYGGSAERIFCMLLSNQADLTIKRADSAIRRLRDPRAHVTRVAWLVPAERAISSVLDEIAASWTLPGRGAECSVQRAVSPSATSDDAKPAEPPDVAAIGRQEAT